MIEDLASLKATTIRRGVSRAGEAFVRAPNTVAADLPAQDVAILNILRACQATQNTRQHLIHRERLGVLQSIDDRAHAPSAEHAASRVRDPRRSVGTIKLEGGLVYRYATSSAI